ncbi:MAG: ATP-binding protein [Bacillus sp. (in: Bacteria)]|nr:ATP-binding protein [Bacillus sp. (in: firmicutes)]
MLKSDPLVKIVQKDSFVGWVYSIEYDVAYVMTNDLWKNNALGIPHNSFLIATSLDPENYSSATSEDKQVILLRVIGSAKLPQDDDIVKMKIDYFQNQTDINLNEDYDDITKNQVQFGGLKCRVIGTFYTKDGELFLGSDLESFYMSTRLSVFRPRKKALEMIVNHIDPIQKKKSIDDAKEQGFEKPLDPFQIGTVRYTSTDRLHRGSEEELVPFTISPYDFLARRTAVLGMTRTGKSNMIKKTVSVVKKIADAGNVNIGQIIFDINGEYANANKQDKGSIADVYPEDTIRYRMLETEGFEDLRNNFYYRTVEGFNTIVRDLKAANKLDSNYIREFVNMSLERPEGNDYTDDVKNWMKRVAAYKVLLYKASFKPPANYTVSFYANSNIRNAVKEKLGEVELPSLDVNPKNGKVTMNLVDAYRWFIALREANNEQKLRASNGEDWVDDSLSNLLDMIAQKSPAGTFISGYKILADSRKYHSPSRTSNEVAREIYDHLKNGKIVILDLSVGDPTVRETISTEIAKEIFNRSMGTFIEGEMPPNIVVYIEEAHNLIGKKLDLTETWPRLAKEGAKYRIALVYATQEPSSVHPNILANTENWFVTHLNNETEVKELAKFYDFSDFSKSLLKAQDVGFARVKTFSSPYVVPVQIDKFDPNNA